ncbi:MAG: UDP-N-acetylglucosamine 2-epimerase (non-hydrolyzing) [Bacteroidales bacterium]|nr:UDP-N-acetylglucosamine 2-epimerase (non-hydrolyzing) [Bacteroidales bacterium]
MKRILTIVGARPQFIKAAAISHTIRDFYSNRIQEDILHTGQHYDDAMSGRFFTELDIPLPKYNLGVGSGSHGHQTALMLNGIEEILLKERYDGVLIYGDTNSTLAGALAASKLQVPVYHVEAGLRSFNRAMPEEVNRIVADHVSTLLFAPTQTAMGNLQREGFGQSQAIFSGDVMLDNVRYYTERMQTTDNLPAQLLVTIHRDFNTDHPERLKSILTTLDTLVERYDTDILFPVHPRTGQKIDSMGYSPKSERIRMSAPLSYLETLEAIQQSWLVLTDSGGLQKEAYFCGRACVILRPETEWVEIVEAGAALLADADQQRIMDCVGQLRDITPTAPTQFGDGRASHAIIQHIIS